MLLDYGLCHHTNLLINICLLYTQAMTTSTCCYIFLDVNISCKLTTLEMIGIEAILKSKDGVRGKYEYLMSSAGSIFPLPFLSIVCLMLVTGYNRISIGNIKYGHHKRILLIWLRIFSRCSTTHALCPSLFSIIFSNIAFIVLDIKTITKMDRNIMLDHILAMSNRISPRI